MPSERPDAAGLTRAKRKKLQLLLERERSATLDAVGTAEGTVRSVEPVSDSVGAAELASEQDDGALLSARMRARFRDVENALAKLCSGTYGFSERSGRPSGYRRLEMIPWARFAADELQSGTTGQENNS